MRTLLQRLLLPPPTEVALSVDRKEKATVRAPLVALVIATDILLLLALRGRSFVRPGALTAFGAINIPLLALDLILTLTILSKRGRWYGPVLGFCVVLEALAALVWIQVTGTVSSYFLLTGPALIVFYRLYFGYTVSASMAGVFVVGHAAVMGFEELSLLPPVSLFVNGASGIHAEPVFRLAALLSISGGYVSAFAYGNYFASALFEKDSQLRIARDEVERAVEEGRPGRLTGLTLAGAYRLQELLGRGGMGEVYQAVRLSDEALVAVKVLNAHHGANTVAVERFRREATVTSRLATKRVVQILDSGRTDDGLHYLVMEYLHGEDLAALLRRRGKLALGELIPIATQIAEALDAAHDASIVHRDVKPQNVFLVSGGDGTIDVRLLDFGISRLLGVNAGQGLTRTAALVGTPGYLAPEQIAEGFGDVGPRTDVFAFGAMLYRALTGVAPFPSRHPSTAAYEALFVRPAAPRDLLSELPMGVDAALGLALAKRPELRPAHASELVRWLVAAEEGRFDDAIVARAEANRDGGLARPGDDLDGTTATADAERQA